MICNCTEVENIPQVKKYLLNSSEEIDTNKVLLFRVVFAGILLSPIFFVSNEILVLTVIGCTIVPIIGFVIPVG